MASSDTDTVTTITPSSSSPTDSSTPTFSDLYSTPSSTSTSNNDNDNDNNNKSSSGFLVNYYYIFLALFLVLCFLGITFVLRKRRLARAAALTHQQSALSRDLRRSSGRGSSSGGGGGGGGGGVGRGWTYGARRDGTGGLSALMRRTAGGADRSAEQEGLNERGEAPPPYKAARDEEDVVTVPMAVLDRGQVGLKPPDYSDAVAREMEVEEEDGVGRGSSGGASTAAGARREDSSR